MREYYTDGAASNNKTKCGGWAWAYTTKDGIISHSGGEQDTTNNRMEMMALLDAMKDADGQPANFYSDSAYLVNCFKDEWFKKWKANGWLTSKKTPVLNKDLWEELLELYYRNSFRIFHVRGHQNNKMNNYVDGLAVAAKKKIEGTL